MSRRTLDTSLLDGPGASVTYQVSLHPDVLSAVRLSFKHSGQSWPEWVNAAFSRLKRESHDELTNLLTDPKPSSRAGKTSLSFRVYPATLESIKDFAASYDSTVQVLLSHAFFMHSLAIED